MEQHFQEILIQMITTSHLQNPLPLPPINDLTCVVTGSTSGIDRETARQLAEAGAHVVMAVRNPKVAQELIQQRQHEWSGRGLPLNIEAMKPDLLSLDSVSRFTGAWNIRLGPLHVLINNAGIFAMGERQKISEDGYEQHMQVYRLAPALLYVFLLPSLIRGSPSRIINVNSMSLGIEKRNQVDIHNLKVACMSGEMDVSEEYIICIPRKSVRKDERKAIRTSIKGLQLFVDAAAARISHPRKQNARSCNGKTLLKRDVKPTQGIVYLRNFAMFFLLFWLQFQIFPLLSFRRVGSISPSFVLELLHFALVLNSDNLRLRNLIHRLINCVERNTTHGK